MITAATVNDIVAAKTMPIETGATYVFDLGYYDYGWWAALDEAACRIVTRFKKNTPLHSARSMPVEPGTGVVSDRIGFLPGRQAKSRKNPMQGAVREVVVTLETGETLRIFSNDLDASAKEIADLYKRRWQIELFFRVMKQTLKITHFIGRSENAVRIQMAVALIAFLLLSLLRKMAQDQQTLLETARTRAHEPYASQGFHPPEATTKTPAPRLAATLAKLVLNMNRTAVALCRPSTGYHRLKYR